MDASNNCSITVSYGTLEAADVKDEEPRRVKHVS